MIMRHVSGGKGEKERKKKGEGRKRKKKVWRRKTNRTTMGREAGPGNGNACGRKRKRKGGREWCCAVCVGVREEEEGGRD